MMEWLLIVIGAATVNNLMLTPLVGLDAALVPAEAQATEVAVTTVLLMTLTATLTALLEDLLLRPLQLPYLHSVCVVMVVAGLLLGLPRKLRAALPGIGLACALLGLAFVNPGPDWSVAMAAAAGLGAGIGFVAVRALLAAALDRVAETPVPHAFAGPGIALVTAGLMALALLGLAGLVRP